MSRGGQKKSNQEPERRCIATGEVSPKTGLIRFVVSPDGMVVPDVAEKLPGRGIWVSAERNALNTAIDKKLFSRAAKTQAVPPDGLLDLTEAQLLRRVTEMLSLARKGGYAVCGFDQVKTALVTEGAAALLQASNGSDGQKRKLRPPTGENTYISCLTAAELGLAFGRESVIHAALAAGGVTENVKREALRLTGVRGKHAL